MEETRAMEGKKRPNGKSNTLSESAECYKKTTHPLTRTGRHLGKKEKQTNK